MHSPAEQTLANASADIDRKRIAEQKHQEKATIIKSIVGNVDEAINYLPDQTVITNYAEADGEQLDLVIQGQGEGGGHGGSKDRFIINGLLKSGNHSSRFPMYRVARKIPNSDRMGPGPKSYEISVADPESKDGFTPLGLITERSSFPHHISGWNFGTKLELTPDQQTVLASEGIYRDPKAGDMLSEVHSILRMAMDQQMEEHAASPEAVTAAR